MEQCSLKATLGPFKTSPQSQVIKRIQLRVNQMVSGTLVREGGLGEAGHATRHAPLRSLGPVMFKGDRRL